MELQNSNLGTQGAKRQTWSGESPRAALHRLVKQKPRATPETIAKLLLEEVRDDDTLLLPILVYWTTRNMRALTEQEPSGKIAKVRAERKCTEKLVVAKMRKKGNARLTLMFLSMVMPNGKLLGDCTGADCAKFGGFYATISKKIGARDLVRKKLSEADMLKLWKARG